ncbi:MAG: flagellar hook-associated protein FlgK [Pseudomonadota bacterium]
MVDVFNVGLSALNASQRQLSTTGHNIANVNTDGYSRQRVDQSARVPQFFGNGFVGKGVEVATIERIASDFLTAQVRNATTNEAESQSFANLSTLVDSLLGDGTLPLALQNFSNATQDVADDPSSIPARSVLLDAGKSLAARFDDLNANLNAIAEGVNEEISNAVTEINSLASAIADINEDIVKAKGIAQGQLPNDLLDARESLVRDLARIISVDVIEQSDGALNVFIGNGLSIVQGNTPISLTSLPDPLDGTRLEVGYEVAGVISPISDLLSNGELGGVLRFRDSLIERSRNEIGRIAATIAVVYNEQHQEGLDLNGNLGGDFFSILSPQVNADPANSGAITVALDNANIGNLTNSDYRLTYDGANFTLLDIQNESNQTLTGAGPFNVDGFIINVTSPPAAGDSYIIQPTKSLARSIDVVVTAPEDIALALPIRAEALASNFSDATIQAVEILDVSNPQLLTPIQLIFADPPTNYQVNGAGPLIPYTSGADIDINGWRVQITGTVEAGDSFTVSINAGGAGDNANALALNDVLQSKLRNGGNATVQDTYGELVSVVGSATREALVSRDALATLREHAESARNSVSAVNLEEEAANLIRFQQSYQAAAELISTGDQMFQSLLAAIRN